MTTQPEEQRTPTSGWLSLHPLTFEDALRGLLEAKSPQKRRDRVRKRLEELPSLPAER